MEKMVNIRSLRPTNKDWISRKILLFLLITFQVVSASPYQLASQYLGSQGIGDEPVLLVKLPRSISSQMQSQLQFQQRGSNQKPTLMYASRQQQAPVSPQDLSAASLPSADQTMEDQSISLTIPLSSIAGTGESPQAQRQVVYMMPQSQVEAQSEPGDSHSYRPALDVDSPLVDFMSEESNGHEIVEQKRIAADESNEPRANQLQQHQDTNLTSTIEQQVRKLLQQQAEQYSTTSVPMIAAQPATTVPSNQLLWLDAQQAQQEQSQNQHQVDVVNKQNSLETSSLLSKLSSSSPDLLLRLRSLLKKAAQQRRLQQLQLAAKNGSLAELDTAQRTGGRTRSELADQYQSSHFPLDSEQLSLGASGSQHLLSTFLASNNLSSHEEIKIPLVVIAMPRIVSLKRNQQKSADSAATSLTHLASQQVHLTPLANYTHNNATLNATHLLLNQLQQHTLNNSLSNSTGDNLAPYLYLASDNTQDAPTRVRASVGQQQSDGADSNLDYTMAPYARQFSMPLATSLASQSHVALENNNYEDRAREQKSHQLAWTRPNQTLAHRYASANSLFAYPSGQSAQMQLDPSSTDFVTTNRTGGELYNMHLRFIESSPRRSQQVTHFDSPDNSLRHQYQSVPKTLFPLDQSTVRQQWEAPVYLKSQAQDLRVDNSSMEESPDSRLISSLARRKAALRQLQLQQQQPLRMTEDRMASLRPIFTANHKRRHLADATKFSAEQMLSLLPRLAGRTNVQQASYSPFRSHQNQQRRMAEPDDTRMAREKLVVMIV